MMMTSLSPMLAWNLPSMEMMAIVILGTSLPVAFLFWMKWWLSSVKEDNPDKIAADQAKADAEHAKHHGHAHGHGHGHASGHGHHV